MRLNRFFWIGSLSLMAGGWGLATVHSGKEIRVELGMSYELTSSNLGETREVLVHFPEGYQQSKEKYPVIFVLDGESHFRHILNAVTILHEMERMPAAIVVGIPNQGKRSRDLSREKDKFKRFINDEVVPMVEKEFRTTGHKTLFGHSLAGYFSLNMLATEPGSFDNYIAASPVIQVKKSELLTKFPDLFKQQKNLEKSLYFTLTSPEAEGQRATEALNRFVALLEKTAPEGFAWQYEFIPNQIHMTTPYLTAYQGLSKVFSDFQTPSFSGYKDFVESGGIDGLKKYFKERGEKYHISKEITESAVEQVGFMLLDEKQSETALQMFVAHSKSHPNSADSFGMLGNAYLRLNEKEKALGAFRTALKLAEEQSSPNSGYYTNQLERLKQEMAQ